VAKLVAGFLDAFNRGDQRQLAASFGPDFQWYSAGSFVTYSRTDLPPYFSARHRHHDRLQLTRIEVHGPSWHGGADIAYALTRRSDDVNGGASQMVDGKGAVNCQERKIFVWSMAAG
jgi:ketosteroid isomerase-like protein